MSETKKFLLADGFAGFVLTLCAGAAGIWIITERHHATIARVHAEVLQRALAEAQQQHAAETRITNELREEVSRQRARLDSVANELRSALAKQDVLLNTIRPTTTTDDIVVEIPQPIITRMRPTI